MHSMSPAPAMMPSVKRKPATRSTSSPGVRIVTATEVGAGVRELGRQPDLQRFLYRELVGRGRAERPGHSPHLDARDARTVADLHHDSAFDGVIPTTTYCCNRRPVVQPAVGGRSTTTVPIVMTTESESNI